MTTTTRTRSPTPRVPTKITKIIRNDLAAVAMAAAAGPAAALVVAAPAAQATGNELAYLQTVEAAGMTNVYVGEGYQIVVDLQTHNITLVQEESHVFAESARDHGTLGISPSQADVVVRSAIEYLAPQYDYMLRDPDL